MKITETTAPAKRTFTIEVDEEELRLLKAAIGDRPAGTWTTKSYRQIREVLGE